MAVKLRLRRMGRKKRPIYAVVAADSRSPRDGRFIEDLGRYHVVEEPARVELQKDRVLYWLEQGAQPSDTVKSLLSDQGIMLTLHLRRKGKSEDEINAEVEAFLTHRATRKTSKRTAEGERIKALEAEKERVAKQEAEDAKLRAEAEAKAKEEAEAAKKQAAEERAAEQAAAVQAAQEEQAERNAEQVKADTEGGEAVAEEAPAAEEAEEALLQKLQQKKHRLQKKLQQKKHPLPKRLLPRKHLLLKKLPQKKAKKKRSPSLILPKRSVLHYRIFFHGTP